MVDCGGLLTFVDPRILLGVHTFGRLFPILALGLAT